MAIKLDVGRRILIVDDNEVDREQVRRLLGSAFSVLEACTASEGLDLCRMLEVDCVLLDNRLPDLDGIEILAELGEGGLPVVMLTGSGSELLAVEAMKRGALDYLAKTTLTRDALLRSVNHALEKASLRGEISRRQAELEAHVAKLDVQRAELERSNERLAESEARLRLILEQLPALTWTTDDKLLCTSLAGADLHQLGDRKNLLGGPISVVFGDHEDSVAAHRRALSGEPASFEANVGDRTYSAHVEPLKNGGAIGGVIGVALDVTEARNLEHQLRQSQKMEALGQLAGGMAHDFNNILTAIVSFSEFVKEALPPGEDPYLDIEEVLKASARGKALVAHMLAFSRRRPVQRQSTDVTDLAGKTTPMLSRLVGENIQLAVHSDGGPHVAWVDPGGLEQVLVNLVINARDAMPDGGTISIETRAASFNEAMPMGTARELAPGDYLQLSVSDTGTGIPPEALELLFEPFYTTKEPGKGTGLGLSTCYGIVRQAGGGITVRSEPSRGTTFFVYLPRATTGEAAPHEEPVPPVPTIRTPPPARSETILIVEDDPQVRAVAARVLKRAGYSVLVASDVEKARELASSFQPGSVSLVLSDFLMPGGTGVDVVDAVKKADPLVAALFMSGYTGDSLDPPVPGASPVLRKPFSASDLLHAVRAALDERSQRDSGNRTG